MQAITTSVNFIFSFVIGQVYLTMLCHLEFGTYIFFAFWVAVMTLYAVFFLPETKGVPVEEMGFVWRWASVVWQRQQQMMDCLQHTLQMLLLRPC